MIPAEEKKNKLNDIANVEFGENLDTLVSSMEILVMMLEFDDDKDIIAACKKRLEEGVSLLKKLNSEKAKEFKID